MSAAFIEPLKKIFTPIITGSVIALIGISLIKVSVINWCGGEKAEDFASMSNIALGAGTLGVIVLLSCAKNRWLRLSSVVVGIAVGCIAAGLSGQFHLHSLGDTLFRLPTLFPFGFQFNSAIFLPGRPGVAGLYSGGGGRSDGQLADFATVC